MGGSTVLVVEDDPSLRLLCRVNLELEQLNVLEAETMGDAIALVRSEPIDVVLLDLHIGEDHGFQLLPYIRESRPEAGAGDKSGTMHLHQRHKMFQGLPPNNPVRTRPVRELPHPVPVARCSAY